MQVTTDEYADWQQTNQLHKIAKHDTEVLALVKKWGIKSDRPAWHLLPARQRFDIIGYALRSAGHRLSAYHNGTAHGIFTVLRNSPKQYFLDDTKRRFQNQPICIELDLNSARSINQL